MYYLAEAFPVVRRARIPVTRDQAMLLLAALNEILIGLDVYLAHNIDGNVRGFEWIPVLFGPLAGVLLLIAGLIALRRRMLANLTGTLIFLASIAVGVVGSYFHLNRGLQLNAPLGDQITATLLVYAPPLLSPLTMILVAVLGISAAWQEEPVESGVLVLPGGRKLAMPYPKSRAYFYMVAMFILATVVSSVLDHARTNFENPWLWLPTFVGIFAMVVTAAMGMAPRITRGDLYTYMAAMLLMMLTGVIGAVLHVNFNLSGQGIFLPERFLRGAPFMAPLLFANMGLLGLLVLLKPGK